MGYGVVGLSFTGGGTLGNVERSLLEDLDTEITGCVSVKELDASKRVLNLRVFTLAVKRGVDSSITEVDGCGATRRSDNLVGDVAV